MKQYGEVTFSSEKQCWIVNAAPNVRALMRRVFVSAQRSPNNEIRLSATDQNSRELAWLLERYPMRMEPRHERLLRLGAAAHLEMESEAEQIMQGRLSMPAPTLTTPLREYQHIAYTLARRVKGLMCADEMGLGKTAVGAALAASALPAVIVCPTHMQVQWRKQLKKFCHTLRVETAPSKEPRPLGVWDVFIVPYSKLSGWRDALAGAVRTVVFDEMQELRKDDSQKHAAASHIALDCEFRIGLSGTPIYNYGDEIFSTMNILRPGCLGTKDEFLREWCTSIGNDKYLVNDPAALRAYLIDNGLMIRRRRIDVGRELPPVTKVKHIVPYTATLNDALSMVKEESMRLAETILRSSSDFTEKGTAARLLDGKLRRATGLCKASHVADLVMEFVKDGQKVVMGAWHREVYEVLLARFKLYGIPHWLYTGSESVAQKNKNFEAFTELQGGGVFIMSNRSGAGLDGLQHCCNVVVYAELDWSPGPHDQLSARVARDGQENGVTIIYCVVEAGSDPVVASVLGIKDEQSQGIVDGTAPVDKIMETQEITESHAKMLARDILEKFSKK